MTRMLSRLSSPTFWLVLGFVALLTTSAGESVHMHAQAPASALPPVQFSCPMHPEIVEDQKGQCPICKMDLEAVRLDTVWSCPVHSVVQQEAAGKCPICRRELAQMTVALSFSCPDTPDASSIDPGKCPNGSPMELRHVPRAHGNHSPQHGGGFFMAADNWHHVEGTYPEEGVFRLYLYDDYTKPLPSDKAKTVVGRVITESSFDSATMTEKEETVFPLQSIDTAPYLEAKIDRLTPPAELSVKVRFASDGPESRFDFSFPAFSKDPVGTAITTADVDPSQLMVEIPNDPKEVLAMLLTRRTQIDGFIQQGAFGQIYVPALQAKDLAIALDVQADTLPAARRSAVAPAVIELVRAAWMLDAYGDMGNRQQIAAAYVTFAGAVAKLEAAFAASAPSAPRQ